VCQLLCSSLFYYCFTVLRSPSLKENFL
jgi:hypothetical protein